MTRWARGGTANTKKPLEATAWKEMAVGGTTASQKGSASAKEVKTQSEASNSKEMNKTKKRATDGQDADNQKKKKEVKRLKLTSSGDQATSVQSQIVVPTNDKPVDFLDALASMQDDTSVSKSERIELLEYVKKDRRREARRVKRVENRQNTRVCFNCRLPGHDLSSCPKVTRDVEQGTGICFKCGSTEHAMTQCKAQVPHGKFPFAKCFICKEVGHLSRNCPDNPRGLYPNGGCCRICESVEHFKKDCPELQKQQGIQDVKLTTINWCTSLDADEALTKQKIVAPTVKTKSKIVRF
jgi:zinc finger CCHC domain-containing protein 9